jgi:hypothetical protein
VPVCRIPYRGSVLHARTRVHPSLRSASSVARAFVPVSSSSHRLFNSSHRVCISPLQSRRQPVPSHPSCPCPAARGGARGRGAPRARPGGVLARVGGARGAGRRQARALAGAEWHGVGGRGRWKRPFDNHREGSSIERSSKVAERMNNLLGRRGASAATLRRDCSTRKQPCGRVTQCAGPGALSPTFSPPSAHDSGAMSSLSRRPPGRGGGVHLSLVLARRWLEGGRLPGASRQPRSAATIPRSHVSR